MFHLHSRNRVLTAFVSIRCMVEDFPLETQTPGGYLVVVVEERGAQDSLNLGRFPFC